MYRSMPCMNELSKDFYNHMVAFLWKTLSAALYVIQMFTGEMPLWAKLQTELQRKLFHIILKIISLSWIQPILRRMYALNYAKGMNVITLLLQFRMVMISWVLLINSLIIVQVKLLQIFKIWFKNFSCFNFRKGKRCEANHLCCSSFQAKRQAANEKSH